MKSGSLNFLEPSVQLQACNGTGFYKPAVAGSIPDGVIGIFQWQNPAVRIMALGSTQPLTEMSARCISWGVKAAGV
jgi:hypothetical protein